MTNDASANTASAAQDARNRGSAKSRVKRPTAGPMKPPKIPPARVSEMARLFQSGSAASAAAKR